MGFLKADTVAVAEIGSLCRPPLGILHREPTGLDLMGNLPDCFVAQKQEPSDTAKSTQLYI